MSSNRLLRLIRNYISSKDMTEKIKNKILIKEKLLLNYKRYLTFSFAFLSFSFMIYVSKANLVKGKLSIKASILAGKVMEIKIPTFLRKFIYKCYIKSFGVNEDYLICLEYRKFLEDNYHIKFAPRQLAINFSNENDFHFDTFGFHGLWNMIYYLPEQDCINIFQNLPKSYWDKNSLDFLLKTSYNRNYTKLHAILLN